MKHGNLVVRGCSDECPTIKDVPIKCCSKDYCNNSNNIKFSFDITFVSLSVLIFLNLKS